MTPRSDLYDLIHAMTAHERRYFRMYARMQQPEGEWNYLRLFDAMLTQDVYDEPALKKQFEGDKLAENFAVEKHYLYMQLLKVLRNFRARKRKDLQVREMLDGVEILATKDMDAAAWRLLKRARKKAEELELTVAVLEAHVLERRLKKRVDKREKQRDAALAALERDGQMLADSLRKDLAVHHLYDRFSLLVGEGYALKRAERRAALAELVAEPELSGPESDMSLQARSLCRQIKGAAAILEQDFEGALRHFGAIRAEWQANAYLIDRYPRRYLRILGNYLTALDVAGRPEDMLPVLDEFKAQKRRFLPRPSVEDRRLLHLEIRYWMRAGKLVAALPVADRMRAFFRAYAEQLQASWKLPTANNLAVVYLLNGRFRDAREWIEYIIQLPPTERRKPIQHTARIFRLIVHYELGNTDLLEYLIRNSGAYLRRHGSMDRFEISVLETMRRLLAAVDDRARRDVFVTLEGLLRDSFGEDVPGREEVRIWAASRATGRPMVDLVGENRDG